MTTKKFVDLIIEIRTYNKKTNSEDYIKNFIINYFDDLSKEPNKLVMLLIEIGKKTKDKINDLVFKFIKICKETKKYDDNLFSHLSSFFNKKTWEYITYSFLPYMSDDFIRKHIDEIHWDIMPAIFNLSEEFIEKYADKLDWFVLSSSQKLSEDLIEKFADKVNWNKISRFQKLSEKFIEKHADKVNWEYIFKYQNISKKFREKHEWRIK